MLIASKLPLGPSFRVNVLAMQPQPMILADGDASCFGTARAELDYGSSNRTSREDGLNAPHNQPLVVRYRTSMRSRPSNPFMASPSLRQQKFLGFPVIENQDKRLAILTEQIINTQLSPYLSARPNPPCSAPLLPGYFTGIVNCLPFSPTWKISSFAGFVSLRFLSRRCTCMRGS